MNVVEAEPLSLSPLPPGIRVLTDVERGHLQRDNPVWPDWQKGCLTCGGEGRFRWWGPDDDQPVEWRCDCRAQWILYRYLSLCGIPLLYQRLQWTDMRWVDPRALEVVDAYIESLDRCYRSGTGLILHGTKGTGKTGLAALILKHALGVGVEGHFCTFNDLLDHFTAGWRDHDQHLWFHSRIKNTGMLVIDDAGKEFRGNEMPQAVLDDVIRQRVASMRPTIITTNHDLDDSFVVLYGEHVRSLLSERSMVYKFEGTDRRTDAGARTMREMELGLSRPLVVD